MFKSQALLYFDAGFTPIPERPNTKIPAIKQWNTRRITRNDVLEFITKFPDANLALRLGNGLMAIDVDTDDKQIQQQTRDILPPDAPEKVGLRGFTLFFEGNLNSENFYHQGNQIIELFGNKKKTSIGIHPATQKPYEWIKPLLGTYTPIITEQHLLTLRQAFPAPIKEIYTPSNYIPDNPATLSEIESALNFINSDMPRDDWLKIGMAIHSFDSNAFDVFNSWSSSSPTYKQQDAHAVWKSFKSGSGITVATIFKQSIANGYTRDYIQEPILHCPLFDNLKAGDTKTKLMPMPPPSLLLDITNWMTETAFSPQPLLSLSAAIGMLGAIKGKRVKTVSNIRSNIYCMSVAETGAGKDHPRKCAEELLYQADMKDIVMGDPASGTALNDNMAKFDNRRLMQIDEFGKFMSSNSSSSASSFQNDIFTVIMKLYSQSSGRYLGKHYSESKNAKEQVIINQPCLCIVGSTTPNTLYDSLQTGQAIDGFLNRWFLFKSTNDMPELNEDGGNVEPPRSLIHRLMDLNCLEPDKPKVLAFSKAAKEIVTIFTKKCREKQREEKNPEYRAAWVRTREQAVKLALIAEDNNIAITPEIMQWSCDVAYFCSQQLLDMAMEYIYDSDYEKKYKKVKSRIKLEKHIGHTKLKQIFGSSIKKQDFDGIIQTLLEAEFIVICDKDKQPLTSNTARHYSITGR